jgi:hypothetical protein
MKWTSRSAAFALFVVVALAVPSAALAAGGPVPPVQGSAIGVPGSPWSYGAFRAGGATIVKRLGAGGVPTEARLRVPGHYGVPGVDYNGTTTGLSADGRTLILAGMTSNGRAPRATRLLVVNTPRLSIRTRITVPGWSTVDAISPDGRWLYLIHYPGTDISKYEVQGYDLLRHRMLPKPIVDPDDRGEAMTGLPVTRVMSPDSRWAYTLYLRPSGAPFVHALDTVRHRAVCIDLPKLAGLDVGSGRLRLASGGARLVVDVDSSAGAVIDTRTLAVVHPVATGRSASGSAATSNSAPRPAGHKSAARASGGTPWGLIGGLLAALAVLALGVVRRTRPGRTPVRVP